MLKRLYKLLKPADPSAPLVIPKNDHRISDADISHSARRVVDMLSRAGYSAYLVGGCVRDLLLEAKPKDFDVATNATPEEVKTVFRSARIIGRRFRIVHVRFGREIIEVTTFRGSPGKKNSNAEHNRSDKGMLLRDNVYGDIRSDALRRDFTVNALYYSPSSGEILDYTNGIEDLHKRQLRLIGDPNARYKEDPVRMLRAVRFIAKLGFSLTPETEAPILQHADYLADVAPARRFEEVLKLFISGYATAVLTKLREFGLLNYLFPGVAQCLTEKQDGSQLYENLIFAAVTNTDKRLRADKRVTPAFIYAAMLWPPLQQHIQACVADQKVNSHEAMQQAAHDVISVQLANTAIPKRFLIPMKEIWSLQARLDRRDGRRAFLLLEHPRFRAAYDFMLLREQAGEKLNGLGLWWTTFQDADDDEKQQMVDALGSSSGNRKRRRRKPRRAASSPNPDAQQPDSQ